MGLNSKEEKIIAAVDALSDQIHNFTARLVAQPSTLGNEQGVLGVMEQGMRRFGLSPQRIGMDSEELRAHPWFGPLPVTSEGRYSLAAVRPADGKGGRSALFNGHLDVVSPEPVEFWKTDPFVPMVKDGWMHGRGAGDMKAGVSAMLHAAAAVERAGFGLAAPLTIEGVIEEECSGNGALACLLAGYDADAVLIPEPFGPEILTSQVGVLWFKVMVSGKAVHALTPHSGANAAEKCFPLIRRLRELEEEFNSEPRPREFADIEHPINLNVGIVKGGDWPSTVPAKAEFHCRLSFFPGQAYEDICLRVRDCITRAAKEDAWLRECPPVVEFYGFRSGGHSLSPGLPALAMLSDCQKDLTGQPAAPFNCTCTTDLRVFALFGKGQCTCFGPVARNIHGANEAVELDSVVHTARAYALFLARWCGLVE